MMKFRTRPLLRPGATVLALALFAIFPGDVPAQVETNPDPKVEELQNQALDKSKSPGDREKSIRELMKTDSDAVLTVAEKLVKDSSPEMALIGVELLGSAAVMSGHGPAPAAHVLAQEPPNAKAARLRHERARKGLRIAAADSRLSVAKKAATTLASISDEQGLQIIQESAQKGVYSDVVAANITSLADADVAATHLKDYVVWASKAGKARAIECLATLPAEQETIRSQYLLNPAVDPELRKAAARVLVKNGEDLLQVAAKSGNELLKTAAKSYIDNNIDKLSDPNPLIAKEALKTIRLNIESLNAIKPGFDSKDISNYLKNNVPMANSQNGPKLDQF